MNKTHHIIYIPGLGDHRAHGQEWAIRLWRLYGMRGQVERMLWHDSQAFVPKLQKLLGIIDSYVAEGRTVSLVAASAGASAALNAYAARKDKVAGVILLCGKVHNAERMHPSVVKENISFGQALALVPQALKELNTEQRSRILSAHPLVDESVPVDDTRVEGAVERTMPVVGHVLGISFGLTLYAPIAIHFLKRQAERLAN